MCTAPLLPDDLAVYAGMSAANAAKADPEGLLEVAPELPGA